MEDSIQWRRLPHFDFEYDLSPTELIAIYQDQDWGPPLKKYCQLALHPNTPDTLLLELENLFLDEEYHSLQRCLWLRSQITGRSVEGLRDDILDAILHQQLRFARVVNQVKQDLVLGIFGMAEVSAEDAAEITIVIETYAVIVNCSIPDPSDKVPIWLAGIAQDALEFARTELYFFYLVPASAGKAFYKWARTIYVQSPGGSLF